jgi:hypothetical protein
MTPQVISLSSATSTAWIPVDYKQNPYNISLALVFSNTPNLTCKVEYTLDDVFNPLITPTAFAHTSLTGITTNTTGSITYPVKAIRLTVTAWTSGTVTLTALQGIINPILYTTTGSGSLVYKFPDWPVNTGFLLASLVAGATASRASNIVTITATGHGVTTGTTYVGFRFYYPGSTNLTAGWYDSVLTIPDANTITFSASGPDFTSESINGGAAWTTITDITSVIIPGGSLRDQSKVVIWSSRTGDFTSAIKLTYITYGASNVAFSSQTISSSLISRMSFSCFGSNTQRGSWNVEGLANASSFIVANKDMSVDQSLVMRSSVSVASAFSVLLGAHMEIIQ